ncbi:MAG: hypothetical protein IKS48_07265 [Eubacterium sp.]|nr:hypothetical protein [Eubacterium sp.]
MKREVIENLNEKDFVASLIMSNKCCQILLPYTKANYFDCDYSRVIVSWVKDYYEKFKVSPKKDITSVYKMRCDEIQDEALKDLVYNYLKNIAESEININNEDYLIDRGKDFIDYKALQEYTENLQACIDTRDMNKARKVQQNYNRISIAETNEVSLLDKSAVDIIKNALKQQEEVLFTMPGEINNVFGNIHRNDFIMIMGGAKKGKSFLLQECGIQAVEQRLNVTLVELEMTREEEIQRLWKRWFGVKSGLVKPGTYETCKFVECPDEKGKYKIELYDVNVKESKEEDVEKLQKQLRAFTKYSANLRVIAYPAGTASVIDICDRVEELATKENFVTDVLLIDYADITKPIGGGTELRNQLNAITQYLRGFAMKFHCCVITATQTNRTGYSSSVVDVNAIAEDYRKITHVTSMVSMEQTPKMKKNHIMRLRNVVMRNGEAVDCCVFPQCLSLGQFVFGEPILAENLIMENEDDED